MRRRLLLLALVAAGASVGHVASGDPRARAGGDGGEHLQFRRTYAEALLECRARNLPLLLARHKDDWGRCTRQYRSVLTNKSFIRWANENAVVLIAHNELGHDPVTVEGETTGEKEERCPLYPGMTCRDHLNVAVDIDNARDEDLVAIPFIELCPNTWLVSPSGEVARIAEKDQFEPKTIEKQARALQKELGKALGAKTWERVRVLLLRAEEAADDEDHAAALRALAALEEHVKEPHPALAALVAARFTTVAEDLALEAEDLLASEAPDDEAKALAKRILEAADVAVYGKHVPVREPLRAWLAKHP